MGIVKGLGKIQDYNKDIQRRREESEANKNKGKVEWFNLKKPGESAKVRFLQELDADSPNYSEKNDLGVLAIMHTGPGTDGWKRKALCTADEGDCFPCEQYKAFAEGWKRPNSLLYINVLVNPGEENEAVQVLSQGTSSKSVVPTVLEYAGETGSITNRLWKITRNGEGTDTTYTIVAFDKQDFEKGVEEYEVFDVASVPRKVAYEEQAAFFGQTTEVGPSAPSGEKSDDGANAFVKW